MEPQKCGRERGRGGKKYIARNTSDSAIGVPHTSYGDRGTIVGGCRTLQRISLWQRWAKDTLVPGALRIYRKFNITQKLETARGILPDIYTV